MTDKITKGPLRKEQVDLLNKKLGMILDEDFSRESLKNVLSYKTASGIRFMVHKGAKYFYWRRMIMDIAWYGPHTSSVQAQRAATIHVNRDELPQGHRLYLSLKEE